MSIPLLPPSEFEKPWIALPLVGQRQATLEMAGAVSVGVTWPVVGCCTCVALDGDVPPTPALIGPVMVPSEPYCVPLAPGV